MPISQTCRASVFCVALLTLTILGVQQAAANPACLPDEAPTVTMYMTSWCPYCRAAHKFFLSHNISVKEIDIESDPSVHADFYVLNPGGGIPFIQICSRDFLGFDEDEITEALGLND